MSGAAPISARADCSRCRPLLISSNNSRATPIAYPEWLRISSPSKTLFAIRLIVSSAWSSGNEHPRHSKKRVRLFRISRYFRPAVSRSASNATSSLSNASWFSAHFWRGTAWTWSCPSSIDYRDSRWVPPLRNLSEVRQRKIYCLIAS